MFNTKEMALDRHAFRGAPHGVSHVWPDEILHPSQWNRSHWSFDDLLKTRARSATKPAFTRDTAMDLLTKLLTTSSERA